MKAFITLRVSTPTSSILDIEKYSTKISNCQYNDYIFSNFVYIAQKGVIILRTLHNIISELKVQGRNQKDLTDFLGIGKNVFTDWKSGKCKSYTKHLPKIAEFLGVSVDYLLGNNTEQKNPLPGIDEERIKELYNMTSDLTDEEILALKSFVAGMKATRKPD